MVRRRHAPLGCRPRRKRFDLNLYNVPQLSCDIGWKLYLPNDTLIPRETQKDAGRGNAVTLEKPLNGFRAFTFAQTYETGEPVRGYQSQFAERTLGNSDA